MKDANDTLTIDAFQCNNELRKLRSRLQLVEAQEKLLKKILEERDAELANIYLERNRLLATIEEMEGDNSSDNRFT